MLKKGNLASILAFAFSILCLSGAPPAYGGTTFTVTKTIDTNDGVCDSDCSLREAIVSANMLPGLDTIAFNIPGAAPHTIQPASALPAITDPVIIDGTTEPDFAGTPVIELNGHLASGYGLHISAGFSTIKGLVINRFGGWGISMYPGGGNMIQGNYIGTDITGTLDLGNRYAGINITGSSNNVIGGSSGDDRNIISGNDLGGIELSGGPTGASGNIIQGNLIGLNAAGTAALASPGESSIGIRIINASNNQIGGSATGAGNVVSGNRAEGVRIEGIGSPAVGNIVKGNLIGTDVTGSIALGNQLGGLLLANTSENVIGGVSPGDGNVISGNKAFGVLIRTGFTPTARANTLKGNYIGVNAAGNAGLGNEHDGILIDNSPENIIGGIEAGAGNVISGNSRHGIHIMGPSPTNLIKGNFIGTNPSGSLGLGNLSDGVMLMLTSPSGPVGDIDIGPGNTIARNGGSGAIIGGSQARNVQVFGNSIHSNSGPGIAIGGRSVQIYANSIHSNVGLGIALGSQGPTPNDQGDGDSGPNNLQNFPELTSAKSSDSQTVIAGNLNSIANTMFTVHYYASSECDASGFGEGMIPFGYSIVTSDSSGDASIQETLTTGFPTGVAVTATATDPEGNTSEFSRCVGVNDRDFDGSPDAIESACGSDPLKAASLPERLDTPGDDDGDTLVNEPLPPGAEVYDCDGDGYVGTAESHVTTSDQDPCGSSGGWPSDLYSGTPGGFQYNTLNVQDLGTFLNPRRFGTSPGHPDFDLRWDLVPGGTIGGAINAQDMAATVAGPSGFPPMFGGARAFGKTCPWAP